MAGSTYKGLASDDDPRYRGGSTIMTGGNLNPHFVKKSRTTRPDRPALPEKPQQQNPMPPLPLPEEPE